MNIEDLRTPHQRMLSSYRQERAAAHFLNDPLNTSLRDRLEYARLYKADEIDINSVWLDPAEDSDYRTYLNELNVQIVFLKKAVRGQITVLEMIDGRIKGFSYARS